MMVLFTTATTAPMLSGGRRAPFGGRSSVAPAAPAAPSRLSMYPAADELSRVSYGDTDSMHTSSQRTMPAAARSAFKALERESIVAIARSRVALSATAAAAAASASPPAQSAIDTLCLVTYSDDEDAASSWQQQQHVQRLFASSALSAATAKATQPGKAGAIFAALCSEDHTEEGDDGLPEVMETLCMLSYDEDSV